MPVSIASEQQNLKKEHARGPHRRGPAKPGQNVLAKQKLHPEEKKGTEKNRDSKGNFSGAKVLVCGHNIFYL
jgi:hypothetical protein